ncbi:MAG TPA: hypothetical protein VFQ73_00580, partial [Flavisolibacter sp.]|nr:hypothetical protein [Flavisolibacter sp.]
LAFIRELRPVSYHLNYASYDNFLRKNKSDPGANENQNSQYKQHLNDKAKKTEIGFLAQDVDQTVRKKGYAFNGVYVPQNSDDNYGLDYSKFVVPLVKAVQEQQQLIEDQNKKIDLQQQQIDLLIKEMQSLKKDQITLKN